MLGRHCIELIGPCDVMRPWSWDEAGSHVRPRSARRCSSRRRSPCSTMGLSRASPPAAARRRALQLRHAPRAPPRGRAGHRRPPARRRPAAAPIWHLPSRGKVTPDGIPCRSRSATSGLRPSSAPTARRSRRRWARSPRPAASAAATTRLAPARRPAREAPPPQARGGALLTRGCNWRGQADHSGHYHRSDMEVRIPPCPPTPNPPPAARPRSSGACSPSPP